MNDLSIPLRYPFGIGRIQFRESTDPKGVLVVISANGPTYCSNSTDPTGSPSYAILDESAIKQLRLWLLERASQSTSDITTP